MARISSAEERDGYVVAVTGALRAADLRRLERACGPAIEQQRPLHIVLAGSCSMDAASRAYVEHLEHRGAVVTTGGQDAPPGLRLVARTGRLPAPASSHAQGPRGEDVMMIRIQRVLCPVDYSGFSRHALDHAAAIARWYAAELTVLHVVPLAIPAPVVPPAEMAVLVERPPDPEAAAAELREFVQAGRRRRDAGGDDTREWPRARGHPRRCCGRPRGSHRHGQPRAIGRRAHPAGIDGRACASRRDLPGAHRAAARGSAGT